MKAVNDKRQPTPAGAPAVFTARHAGQAPEIDSVVFVQGRELHPGEFVDVTITDYQAYDLVAEMAKSKSRKLAVLAK